MILWDLIVMNQKAEFFSNTLKNLKFKDLKRCWMNRYNKRKNVYFILQV